VKAEYRLREKDILMEENRNLTRELKLLDLIIENFIPQEEVNQLNQKLEYDKDQDEWFVKDDLPPNVISIYFLIRDREAGLGAGAAVSHLRVLAHGHLLRRPEPALQIRQHLADGPRPPRTDHRRVRWLDFPETAGELPVYNLF